MYKVILDTDIGDDIDDAFALLLILRNKQVFDLKAVTTVYKNTKCRAHQAKKLLSLEGSDVEVYMGERVPLDGYITPFPKDQGDLTNILTPQFDEGMLEYPINDNAVDAIINLAHKYSKELIIFMVGAATNIAKAIQKDPSIVNDIKAIYAMSGNYSVYTQEWNVMCDPVGLDIIYKSGIPFYGIGCDVTMKCLLDGKLLEDVFNQDNETFKNMNVWFNRWMEFFHFEKSVLHDPLAVSVLVDNKICEFKEVYAKVTKEGLKRGSVEVIEEPKEGFSKINVASTVNKERFFDLVRKSYIK